MPQAKKLETTQPQPKRTKYPRAKFALRLVVSLGLLMLLWTQLPSVTLASLQPNWSPNAWLWLIGAAGAKLVAFTLSTQRWQRALATLTTPPSFLKMFNLFLAGQFVSNIVPTAIGGDVIRVRRLARTINSAPRAFASVALERLTGWLVLPSITFGAMIFDSSLLELGRATRIAVTVSATTLVALILIILIASNRRFTGDIDEMAGARRYLTAIHLGVDAMRRDPADAIGVVASGLAFQITQSTAVWMAAQAIGLSEVTVVVALAFFPVTAILQNIPLGVGGLGVREGLFVLFFGAVGADEGLAVTLGLLVHVLTILTSISGAPSFIMGNDRDKPTETAKTSSMVK